MAVSGTTGNKCQQSGIYDPSCSDTAQIALSDGDTFPPCRKCTKAITWTLAIACKP